jgi:hypothetical protein
MKVSGILVFLLFFVTVSCYRPQRACKDFKDGQFSFTTTINGEKKTTRFTRFGNTEIDFFEGKSDTSTIRWINDCEYIVKKTNPNSRSEEKSIHMKILTTTDSSYTFEYGIVGSSKKSRGTAIKVN